MAQNSFTVALSAEQMARAAEILRSGNYRPVVVPYTVAAAEGDGFRVMVYQSGKCLVQGKGAEDWVRFTLEPLVLGEARLGYEEQRDPKAYEPHMGVDESGKGDFFGPLVVAAAFTDRESARDLVAMGVRDSKAITSDRAAVALAGKIKDRLGDGAWCQVTIGPAAYNRMYGRMGSVNRVLAWGHAKCIELLLEKVPGCPRALCDQFGPEEQIRRALQEKGRKIVLEQRTKAESDVAVAAASILARAGFLAGMGALRRRWGVELPKGASGKVKSAAAELVRKAGGGGVLLEAAKCHFKTTDEVLGAMGMSREGEGLPAAAERRAFTPWRPRKESAE